ncbi:MAG: VWA domain-containing protein [Desulfobacterales bacterium]|nr:VWA domain-containing protein [Desulfobacterales bacterium]
MMIFSFGYRRNAFLKTAAVFAALTMSGLGLAAGADGADSCEPLLIPGKKTLLQRVITHPGARLYSEPGADAGALIAPFSVLYVYERAARQETGWLKVGYGKNCEIAGWIRQAHASDWRQALTLKFTERMGRRPVLFFQTLEDLNRVAGSDDPAREAAALADRFESLEKSDRSPPEGFPIMAMEPSEEAVSRDRFYLMPIFHTAELYEGVKFLEVASIDPGTWRIPLEEELRTAIVFVMDTTISMKPYIDRTRKAVQNIFDRIEKAGQADKVAFGLVAHRSSTEKTPGLGYVSKVLSPLRDGTRRSEFEQALVQAREAEVSSHSFNEDAFAGIQTAVEALNWSDYQSRILFLITDAGAIQNDDPFSSTGMNAAQIADLAAAKNIKIFVLHLKTPAGRRQGNHTFAETQYKSLTGQSDPNIGDLYVPIDAGGPSGGVETFGSVVEEVSKQMVELVRATAAGERLDLAARNGLGGTVAEARRKAAVLGYAMQLDFLGHRRRTEAPKVVKAWVSDMDLARPDTPSFQVTVLLTKNQLSDLYRRLKIILEQAQRTKRTGARDFFQSILSASARISRDPEQFSKRPDRNLGQLGLLGEFLDDLPYRSSIMRLEEDDWYRMSVGEQQAIVDDLKSKIKRYRLYHDDVDNWVSFGAADPGQMVHRVPLSILP